MIPFLIFLKLFVSFLHITLTVLIFRPKLKNIDTYINNKK